MGEIGTVMEVDFPPPILPLLFDGDDVTIVIIGVTQPVCDSLRSHLPLSPDPRVPAIKPAEIRTPS